MTTCVWFVLFWSLYVPSSPLILIGPTIFWSGTNEIYDFWDARCKQGLYWKEEENDHYKCGRNVI